MEPEKIFNVHSMRYLTKNGVQYNKLISQGFYLKDNQLYSPEKSSTKTPKTHTKKHVKKVSKKRTQKQWVEKKTVEPTVIEPVKPEYIEPAIIEPVKPKEVTFSTILEPTLNNVLNELAINDLLSLYITNKEIHDRLNDAAYLRNLSGVYGIQASSSFSEFLTNYNLLFIPYNQQYLYKLENNIEVMSDHDYQEFSGNKRDVTPKMRAILIDWLMEVEKMFKIDRCAISLSVTLLDAYLSKIAIVRDKLLGLGCACLYVAAVIMVEYPPDISDMAYVTDGAFSSDDITAQITDLIKVLNGVIIRPSIMFYVPPNDVDMNNLAKISYFPTETMICKPSLVHEAMHYMLYGTYKIYTLEEINLICKKLVQASNNALKSSLNMLKTAGEALVGKIKFVCGTNTTPIKSSKFVYNKEWHIHDLLGTKIKTLGEGAYGSVKHLQICSKDYAVKTSSEHFNESITEIMVLQNVINHPNVITLCNFEMFPKEDKSKLYMPLMDGTLTSLIEKNALNENDFPKYFKQMILGLHYCHAHDIIVRDIKDPNIVYSKSEDQLKLIDFGLSVPYSSYRKTLDPGQAATLWYRAPEPLLGDGHYTTKIDIWAIGCVIVFMINKQHLFRGDSEREQLYEIFRILGTPTEQTWPGVTKFSEWQTFFPIWKPQNLSNFIRGGKYIDIISACLTMDPTKRFNTQQLLDLLHITYHL